MNILEAGQMGSYMGRLPIVDVRSPAEFHHGHITSARNIPLFSDIEREMVGKIYADGGQAKAIEKGIELAGPKLHVLIKDARNLSQDHQLLIHCWRGGMRSEKMAWLLETAGISCWVLKGGYKAYRNQLFRDFKDLRHVIVLYGPTGSGKTEILKNLALLGEQVVDLESLAGHRGSAFGDIGMENQPTSMQFQNDIHHEVLKLDRDRRIWIEGESMNIGKVYLPDTLWETMRKAFVVNIRMPSGLRTKRIVKEYGDFSREALISAVRKIERRFGGDRARNVIKMISENSLEKATEELLTYYDRNYLYGLKNFRTDRMVHVETSDPDPGKNAQVVLEAMLQYNPSYVSH